MPMITFKPPCILSMFKPYYYPSIFKHNAQNGKKKNIYI